ncbi:MAG: 50S ribosomal protein L15 [Candidatus Paceibacterota bacterium]|jgi:large subunit ribosomal protein L15
MQLNDLRPKKAVRKSQKRVGRGGKRGTTSGRGQKGQRARSGHRIRPAQRDLLIRIPKLRGVKNRVVFPKSTVINVRELVRLFPTGEVTKKNCIAKGLIPNLRARVKILGEGEVKKAFVVEGCEVSKEARKKIEAAGGTIK